MTGTTGAEEAAKPLTAAAKKAAKSNQWVAYVAGGGLAAIGVFMLVMDVVYPSAPGHSATPVGLGFIAAGLLFTLAMRPLLRRRARDAAAMGEQIAERAAHVSAGLAREGKLSFYRASKAGALGGTLFLNALFAWLFVLIDSALQENRGIDIGWAGRGAALALLPISVLLSYRVARGWRYELTDSTLCIERGSRSQEVRFDAVQRATMRIVGMRSRGTHVGFQVTLTMFTASAKMALVDTLAPRRIGSKPPKELTRGDVLCWVWLNKGKALGLQNPPA
jgi:hypothetical protein